MLKFFISDKQSKENTHYRIFVHWKGVFPPHTIVTSQYQVFTLSPTSDSLILCNWLSFLWRFQLWDKLYQTLFFQILLWWMSFKYAILSLYIWWIFLLRFVKLVNIVEVLYPSLKQIHIIWGLYSEWVFFLSIL